MSDSLRAACIELLKEVSVGEGKILCPPAFEPAVRAIYNALREPASPREQRGDINRLQTFLYLLMRDELPTGVVSRTVKECTVRTGRFTAGPLAVYAGEMAEWLVGESEESFVPTPLVVRSGRDGPKGASSAPADPVGVNGPAGDEPGG